MARCGSLIAHAVFLVMQRYRYLLSNFVENFQDCKSSPLYFSFFFLFFFFSKMEFARSSPRTSAVAALALLGALPHGCTGDVGRRSSSPGIRDVMFFPSE